MDGLMHAMTSCADMSHSILSRDPCVFGTAGGLRGVRPSVARFFSLSMMAVSTCEAPDETSLQE